MSFTRLLNAARKETLAESLTSTTRLESAGEKNAVDVLDVEEEGCLNNVAEFIFDLFDANCLPGYQRISAFETRVCDDFAEWEDGNEMTLQQHEDHVKFQKLFEIIVGNFLEEKGWSQKHLYEKAEEALRSGPPAAIMANDAQSSYELAAEIRDVCLSVSDIKVWAKEMRELAHRTSSAQHK